MCELGVVVFRLARVCVLMCLRVGIYASARSYMNEYMYAYVLACIVNMEANELAPVACAYARVFA